MHRLSLFIGLLASVTLSFAGVIPRSIEVDKFDGEVNENSYIVKVKDGANKDGVMGVIADPAMITHTYDPEFMNAFTGLSSRPLTCVTFGPD
jgi:hypothetical protein